LEGLNLAYCTRLLTSGDKALRLNPSQKEGRVPFWGNEESPEEFWEMSLCHAKIRKETERIIESGKETIQRKSEVCKDDT
jgi:hypothetical protein